MKQFIIIPFLFFSLQSVCQQTAGQELIMVNLDSLTRAEQIKRIGKPFPEFNTFFQDKAFTNQNLAGKIVFINFWFASCAPCIAEFDALNELYEKLKNKSGFEFISFTYESPDTVKEIIEKYSIKYKVITMSQKDIYRLANGFPTSVVLDKNGSVIFLKGGGSSHKEIARNIVFSEFYPKLLSVL